MLLLKDLVGYEPYVSPFLPFRSFEEIYETFKGLGAYRCHDIEELLIKSQFSLGLNNFQTLVDCCARASNKRSPEVEKALSEISVRDRILIQVKAADLLGLSCMFREHEPASKEDLSREQVTKIIDSLIKGETSVAAMGSYMLEDANALLSYMLIGFIYERGLGVSLVDFFVSPHMGAMLYHLTEWYKDTAIIRYDAKSFLSNYLVLDPGSKIPEVIQDIWGGVVASTVDQAMGNYTYAADTPFNRGLLQSSLDRDESRVGDLDRIEYFEKILTEVGI